jgi:transcriptional regulator with XRE-family HTH domain
MGIFLQIGIDKNSKRDYHIVTKAQNEQKGDEKMLNNIEAERVRYRLSKEELAKRLNVSVKTYYNWINEETDAPISKLVILAKMFGTKVDYLIEGMSGVAENVECLRKESV